MTARPATIAPSDLVQKTRLELAACYRMFARREMDDLIYTHLSVEALRQVYGKAHPRARSRTPDAER